MKKLEVFLPTSFSSVDLNKQTSKQALEKYNNKIVMIKDFHLSSEATAGIEYILGQIQIDESDGECYYFQLLNQKKPKRLHYHDLKGLMIPSKFSDIRAVLHYED